MRFRAFDLKKNNLLKKIIEVNNIYFQKYFISLLRVKFLERT